MSKGCSTEETKYVEDTMNDHICRGHYLLSYTSYEGLAPNQSNLSQGNSKAEDAIDQCFYPKDAIKIAIEQPFFIIKVSHVLSADRTET